MTDTTARHPLRSVVKGPYNDLTPTAFRFRMALLAIDVITVLYFVISTFFPENNALHLVDVLIGLFYLGELLARVWIEDRALRFIFHPLTLLDMAVIGSLFAPFFVGNLIYLRLLRTLRLIHSYSVLEELRRNSSYIRRHVEVILAITHLIVFLFVTTAIIYIQQNAINPQIENYLDALYFAVATLTTTGYGDITLVGVEGRVLAIVMMIVGVSLFIRLLQAVFQPRDNNAEEETSPQHCPHCGAPLNEKLSNDQ